MMPKDTEIGGVVKKKKQEILGRYFSSFFSNGFGEIGTRFMPEPKKKWPF
jgi:hypothetical protein